MRTVRLRILAACLIAASLPLGAILAPLHSGASGASCDDAVAAGPDVVLNEVLPLPASDWNGDGMTGPGDSFVELYNRGDAPRSVANWSLSGGGATFTFARGGASVVAPGGYLVVFGSASGASLLQPGGGDLALVSSGGDTVDACRYPAASPDVAYARLPDGSGGWSAAPPTPGKANAAVPVPTPPPPTWTPTATAAATATATATATGTATLAPTAMPSPASSPAATATASGGASPAVTPATAAPSPSASPTPTATPTPSATPRGAAAGAVLNEVLADPAADWNGDGSIDPGDQAIELAGVASGTISLAGWQVVADTGQRFTLPRGFSVSPGGLRALYGSQTGIILRSGGELRLLDAAGNLVDDVVYPQTAAGTSWARLPDATGVWQVQPPSPDGTNARGLPSPTPSPRPTPTPTSAPTAYAATPVGGAGRHLELSQVLSNPSRYDWDGDGVVSLGDQFITVVNPTTGPLDLTGYQLSDSGGQMFAFPRGLSLSPRDRLTLFQSQSLLLLKASGDTVTLLAPDGSALDEARVGPLPPDLALVRSADGAGTWSVGPPLVPPPSLATPTPTPTPATPRAAEAPGPSPEGQPARVRLALASPRTRAVTHRIRVLRRTPHNTIVTIEGQVTYPAGLLLGARAMVLQEDGVAALVRAEFDVPPFPLDEVVEVTGKVRQSDEGTEVIALSPDDVAAQEMGSPVAPLPVASTSPTPEEGFRPIGEAPVPSPTIGVPEGILVRVDGSVTERRQHSWRVDVGADPYIVEGAALESVAAPIRSAVEAVGVVVYRPATAGSQPRRFAPFSSLLRRDGERVVLIRGAADVTVTAPTPTPTRTPRPTRTAEPGGTPRPSRAVVDDSGTRPSRWPKVGEGGSARQESGR